MRSEKPLQNSIFILSSPESIHVYYTLLIFKMEIFKMYVNEDMLKSD